MENYQHTQEQNPQASPNRNIKFDNNKNAVTQQDKSNEFNKQFINVVKTLHQENQPQNRQNHQSTNHNTNHNNQHPNQ